MASSDTHMSQISTERWNALPNILRENKGAHLVVLSSSMPMIYNLQLSEQRLQSVGKEVGVSIERVGHVDGMWLYRLTTLFPQRIAKQITATATGCSR